MKKIFLSAALCAVAMAASAQLKSVDAKLDLRGETGFGAGVTLGLGDKLELAPSVSLFFPGDDITMYQAEANVHYILPFEFHENLQLYPIGGVGYFHYDWDYDGYGGHVEVSDNELLINVGAGARWHFNEQWAAFAEEKYQIVDGYNDNFLSIGISYKF